MIIILIMIIVIIVYYQQLYISRRVLALVESGLRFPVWTIYDVLSWIVHRWCPPQVLVVLIPQGPNIYIQWKSCGNPIEIV